MTTPSLIKIVSTTRSASFASAADDKPSRSHFDAGPASIEVSRRTPCNAPGGNLETMLGVLDAVSSEYVALRAKDTRPRSVFVGEGGASILFVV